MKKNRALAAISVCALALSMTAAAAVEISPRAWLSFSGTLPAKANSTEIAEARKSYTDNKFSVTVNSDDGVEWCHAWTESAAGINYSLPTSEVEVNSGRKDFTYNKTVPSVGSMVTLNLDNVASEDATYDVSGTWSPW